MTAPRFSDLPDFDSELFEQVTDDELALLECYRVAASAARHGAGGPLSDGRTAA